MPDDRDVPPSTDLGQLIARVREMPVRVRSLRVETHGWVDRRLSMAAQNRAHQMLVPDTPGDEDAPVRRSDSRALSWMEFGDDGWGHASISVWPARWREELDFRGPDDEVSRAVSGRDRDAYWWEQGDRVFFVDARTMKRSLKNWWVVNQLWVDAPVDRDLVDASSTILGRAAARVVLTRQPRRDWAAGPFFSGDRHELIVDVATGMTLAITGFHDGSPFQHEEVVDLEINPGIDRGLTEAPPTAEPAPPRGLHSPSEVAAAAGDLSVLVPTWLPPGFTFSTGVAETADDGVMHAFLYYSRDRREFMMIREYPDAPVAPVPEGWELVARGDRTVLVSDLSDAEGERIAYTQLAGTRAMVMSRLAVAELLDLAFSFEVLAP